MDDDEAPPELVDVTTLPFTEKATLSQAEEPAASRVPITLVTGRKALPSLEGRRRRARRLVFLLVLSHVVQELTAML